MGKKELKLLKSKLVRINKNRKEIIALKSELTGLKRERNSLKKEKVKRLKDAKSYYSEYAGLITKPYLREKHKEWGLSGSKSKEEFAIQFLLAGGDFTDCEQSAQMLEAINALENDIKKQQTQRSLYKKSNYNKSSDSDEILNIGFYSLIFGIFFLVLGFKKLGPLMILFFFIWRFIHFIMDDSEGERKKGYRNVSYKISSLKKEKNKLEGKYRKFDQGLRNTPRKEKIDKEEFAIQEILTEIDEIPIEIDLLQSTIDSDLSEIKPFIPYSNLL